MVSVLSKGLLALGSMVFAGGGVGSIDDILASVSPPQAQAQPQAVSTPQVVYRTPLSETDAANLLTAIGAAKTGQVDQARMAMDALTDPLARKIALWALIDSYPEALSFFELDAARRDLSGWPRGAKRQASAERLLETSGLDPARIVAWFGGADPQSPEGAMALASAYRQLGKQNEAGTMIRRFWRDKAFEVEPQRTMLARFGDLLTVDDHIRRADVLLYGPQGPAAKDIVALLPEPYRSLGEIRIGLRSNVTRANERIAELPQGVLSHAGLAFEKAAYLRRKGEDALALQLVRAFPTPLNEETAGRIWIERRALIVSALKASNWQGAYSAAANTGMTVGADAAEAEFYAGWLALSRLKNPQLAARHFALLAGAGTSPITRGRALYWQGRAAEAMGDQAAAKAFYEQGAQHITTFYGQLAAEKAGIKQLALGRDPMPTQADRARFEGRELVRASRVLIEIGERDLFRGMVLFIDDTLPNAEESALLVDLARQYGDQDLGMRAVRTAAQRGFILPERGYPVIGTPTLPGMAEPAFVLSITRQESNFDPNARSGVGARGMMQLMPATAQTVARRLGEPYSAQRLAEPQFNMRLGASYLGQMVEQFSGSYVMAAAAYNAGPGRPPQWAAICGDPRGGATDPLDFIECIPFSETRNYVMRTLETTQVYRARLNGGTAPLVLSADLKRGGYTYNSYSSLSTTP